MPVDPILIKIVASIRHSFPHFLLPLSGMNKDMGYAYTLYERGMYCSLNSKLWLGHKGCRGNAPLGIFPWHPIFLAYNTLEQEFLKGRVKKKRSFLMGGSRIFWSGVHHTTLQTMGQWEWGMAEVSGLARGTGKLGMKQAHKGRLDLPSTTVAILRWPQARGRPRVMPAV